MASEDDAHGSSSSDGSSMADPVDRAACSPRWKELRVGTTQRSGEISPGLGDRRCQGPVAGHSCLAQRKDGGRGNRGLETGPGHGTQGTSEKGRDISPREGQATKRTRLDLTHVPRGPFGRHVGGTPLWPGPLPSFSLPVLPTERILHRGNKRLCVQSWCLKCWDISWVLTFQGTRWPPLPPPCTKCSRQNLPSQNHAGGLQSASDDDREITFKGGTLV